MNRLQPHIGIIYYKGFPDVDINSVVQLIKTDGLKLEIQEKEPEIYAAMEWIVPTAIGAYIAKPYFDSFLSEAGKDHYQLLKKGLKFIAGKCKDITMKMIAAAGSERKLNGNYNQSQAFSIVIQLKQDKRIKLLFDNDLTKEDWDNAIDLLFDYIIENYEKHPDDRLSKDVKELEDRRNTMVYALINKETKGLDFYDDMGLFKKQRRNDSPTVEE